MSGCNSCKARAKAREKTVQGENNVQIPKIIHKIWFDIGRGSSPPVEKYGKMMKSVVDVNPGWEIKTWSKDDARNFIAANYSWFLPYWDGYKNEIYRIDAIRYFILHYYGGFYLDQDIHLHKSLDEIVNDNPNKSVILVRSGHRPFKISNFAMGAVKGDPFFEFAAKNLMNSFNSVHHRKKSIYSVFYIAGPIHLNRSLEAFHKSDPSHESQVAVLDPHTFYPSAAKDGQKVYGEHAFTGAWSPMENAWGDVLYWSLPAIAVIMFITAVVCLIILSKKRCSKKPEIKS